MQGDPTGFPLSWPIGWARARSRGRARFGRHSMIRACEEIYAQLSRMNVPDWRVVISTNVELRRDGLPYSNRRAPLDPGAAVYFKLKGADRVLACDCWDRVEHNLWAIAKHLEALRGQERWGVGTLDQAFTGYKALPAAGETSGEPWWVCLGVDAPPASYEDARRLYRQRSPQAHPDCETGSEAAWRRLQAALEQAKAHYGVVGAR